MLQGITLSIMASTLFGAMYYYTSLLHPLSSEAIFGWRMLLTVPFMTLLLGVGGEWHQVRAFFKRIATERTLWVLLPLSSALLNLQLWLFMWAPAHGHALDVSMGYFMLPLTLIAMGRLAFGERLSMFQAFAAALACVGVVHELWRVGHVSWPALLVCLGFPLYFYLRRRYKTDHLAGLWVDMSLSLPVAIWFLAAPGWAMWHELQHHPELPVRIVGLGLISVSALMCYMAASKRVPLGLFGLLGYVEPVLLVLVALALGEQIAPDQWPSYIPIWMAVGVLVIEGLIKGLQRPAGLNAA